MNERLTKDEQAEMLERLKCPACKYPIRLETFLPVIDKTADGDAVVQCPGCKVDLVEHHEPHGHFTLR